MRVIKKFTASLGRGMLRHSEERHQMVFKSVKTASIQNEKQKRKNRSETDRMVSDGTASIIDVYEGMLKPLKQRGTKGYIV